MPTLQIEHGVQDYDAWKAAFDSDPVGRAAGGVRSYRVMRPSDDPNHVVVDLEFDTIGEAEAFREKLRALWAGTASGLVLEGARARILDVVEVRDV
jgi:ribosomal protein L35AE/L33A